jgi:tape measure domain-containing protein
MVVAITGDTSDFNLSIDAADKKLKLLAQVTAQSAADMSRSFKNIDNEAKLWGNSTDLLKQKQQSLRNEMTNLMAQGFDPMSTKIQSLKTQYGALDIEIKDLEKSQISLKNNLSDFARTLTSTGMAMSIGVTAPIVAAGTAAVRSAAQMEMYTTSFEVMLASKSKAEQLTKEAVALAAVTPFNVPEVMDATKMLLQYGVGVKEVLPMVRMLGDASGGMKDKFGSLVLAFSQMQAAGKVLSQDLRQMATAGFNPLKAISDTTGESMESLAARMDKGKISIQEVNKAMVAITSEGGRFYQGMEKGSKTLSGLFSTLQDNIGITGRSLVNDYMPAMKKVVVGAIEFTQKLTTLDTGTRTFILTMAAFAAITGPVMLGIGGVMKALAAFNVVQKAVMLTTGGWVLAIGAAVAVIATLISVTAQARKETDALAKSQDGLPDATTINLAVKALDKQISAQKVLLMQARDRGDTEEDIAELQKDITKSEQERLDLGNKLRILDKDRSVYIEKEVEATNAINQAQKDITKGLKVIDQLEQAAKVTNENYNATAEKRNLVVGEINKLLEAGYLLESENVQQILTDYDDLLDAYDKEQIALEAKEKTLQYQEELAIKRHEEELKRIEALKGAEKNISDYRISLLTTTQKTLTDIENARTQVNKDIATINKAREEKLAIDIVDITKKYENEKAAIILKSSKGLTKYDKLRLESMQELEIANAKRLYEIEKNKAFTSEEINKKYKDDMINLIKDLEYAQISSGKKRKDAELQTIKLINAIEHIENKNISKEILARVLAYAKEADERIALTTKVKERLAIIEGNGFKTFKQIDSAAAKVREDAAKADIDLTKWTLIKKLDLTTDYINKFNTIASNSISTIFSIIDGKASDALNSIKSVVTAIGDSFGDTGKAVANSTNSMVDSTVILINTIEEKRSRAEKNKIWDATYYKNLRLSIIAQEIAAENQRLSNELSAIEKQKQAALKAIGASDADEKVRAKKKSEESIATKKKEYDKETDLEKKKILKAEIDEAALALKKQNIIDAYDAKKIAAEEASAKITKQLALDKAKIEQKIAIAMAKIDKEKAIADLGWFAKESTKDKVRGLYNDLISAIKATPLPTLGTGGIVMPKVGGVPTVLAERGMPEIVFPLDQLEKFLSKNTITNTGSTANDNAPWNITIKLSEREIYKGIHQATKNHTVLIDATSVVK